MITVEQAREALGLSRWTDYQLEAFQVWESPDSTGAQRQRFCVYYPTGKGKTMTMMTLLALRGYAEALIITPPTVAGDWHEAGRRLGIETTTMSHAKFRMKDTRVSRQVPVIVDEFHLLGGHTADGWTKFDKLAEVLKAPVIIGSATPSYNDAERVYCIAHVLDPWGNRGGFLSWLYTHCTIAHNPHSATPFVTGFHKYDGAPEFLSAMENVVYLPDEAPDILQDLHMGMDLPDEFERFNLDRSRGRIMASSMEIRQRTRYLQIVNTATNRPHDHVYDMLGQIAGEATKPILVFTARATVGKALASSLADNKVAYGYVDGSTSPKRKEQTISAFRDGDLDILVGTASIATGTDGLDKVADVLVILDDTDDASLRRQLVGRVLPRGTDPDYTGKVAYRFMYNP